MQASKNHDHRQRPNSPADPKGTSPSNRSVVIKGDESVMVINRMEGEIPVLKKSENPAFAVTAKDLPRRSYETLQQSFCPHFKDDVNGCPKCVYCDFVKSPGFANVRLCYGLTE